MKTLEDKYQAAVKNQSESPDTRRVDALLGMGFLLGAEMYGAAAAMSALYVREYGWDALPDIVKQLEGDDE